MLRIVFFWAVTVLLIACQSNNTWHFDRHIDLQEVAPIGILIDDDGFWISDSDNNRVVRTDADGKIQTEYEDFERPMHIGRWQGGIVIPEYGSDSIRWLKDGERRSIDIPEKPDAPAGVDMQEGIQLVADFYNHRVIYNFNGENRTFGSKGDGDGQFHYPTDVQYANDRIYVADAYNHRVQVFDSEANHLQTFGAFEEMNASTGIYVTPRSVYITDFENSRVLEYDLNGTWKSTIADSLSKPTDLIEYNGDLYILNYDAKSIAVFTKPK